MGFSSTVGSSMGSRYAGFGSGAYANGNNGGGISFNGDALSYGELVGYPQPKNKYDEDDDDGLYHSDSNTNSPSKQKSTKEENLFDSDNEDDFGSFSNNNNNNNNNKKNTTFDDDDWGDFACGEVQENNNNNNNKQNALLDDDFTDFQHAVVDEPTTSNKKQDLFDLLGDDTTTTITTSTSNQFDGFNSQPIIPSGYQQKRQPQQTQTKQPSLVDDTPAVNTPTGMWAQASNFVSLDSLGKKSNNNAPTTGPSMNTLKSSSVQADWNNWASSNQQAQTPKPKTNAFDDLLF